MKCPVTDCEGEMKEAFVTQDYKRFLRCPLCGATTEKAIDRPLTIE